jgi:hypothetical protein
MDFTITVRAEAEHNKDKERELKEALLKIVVNAMKSKEKTK